MLEYTQTKKRASSSRYIEGRSKSYSDLSKNPSRVEEGVSLNYIYAFGRNRHSQLPPANTPSVLSIACGEKHTVYLNSKYEVFVMGDNQCGQLGLPVPYTSTPLQLLKDKVVSNVYTTAYCTFLLTCRGQLYVTGKNNKGQLGIGNLANQTCPTLVQQLSHYRNGRVRTKTIISCSTVLTQRQGLENILKDQTPEKRKFFQASSKDSGACVLEEGELVKEISGGPLHTMILTTTGRLFTCGLLLHNLVSSDECSSEVVELKLKVGRIQHVFSGMTLNAVLTCQGRVYLWGVLNDKFINQPTQIDMKNIACVGLGGPQLNYVANTRGELYQILDFEQGKYFRTKKLEGLGAVRSIACGADHVVVMTEENALYGWGDNKYGQIRDSQKASVPHFHTPVMMEQQANVSGAVCGSYYTIVLGSRSFAREARSGDTSTTLPPDEVQSQLILRKQSRATKTQTQTASQFQIPNINPRTFTTSLQIPFEQLVLEKQISEGGYGIIYKGKWRETTVAIKIFKIDGSDNGVKDFLSECHAMEAMRHPNIVMFLGACTKAPHYAIVLEYCSKGTLWSILHSSMDLSWEDRRRFALDTAKGMHYLHSFDVPVLHRDLKSLNLLIDQSYRVKLADFGWTKGLENYMTGKIGTYQWMAPEVISGQKYTEKADIFSFGIILWQIASREPPYRNVSGHQVSIEVVNNQLRPPIPKKTPQPFIRMMKRCWDKRPEVRPSFKEIIRELQGMKLTQ